MTYENPPQNLNIKCRRKNGKVHFKIEFDIEEDKWNKKEEFKARVDRCAPWLLEHLYTWADFDHHYTLELFCDSLENLGKGLIRWDNALHARRTGRRALRAASQLRTAYADKYCLEDKSYTYWSKQNPIKWIPVGKLGMCQMSHDYAISEEYSEKMWKTIIKRCDKWEKQRKEEAWKYIHKHLESFWD